MGDGNRTRVPPPPLVSPGLRTSGGDPWGDRRPFRSRLTSGFGMSLVETVLQYGSQTQAQESALLPRYGPTRTDACGGEALSPPTTTEAKAQKLARRDREMRAKQNDSRRADRSGQRIQPPSARRRGSRRNACTPPEGRWTQSSRRRAPHEPKRKPSDAHR